MHFPARAASTLFWSIFGHTIGVLKSPALFRRKELQVTRFKAMCFSFNKLHFNQSKTPRKRNENFDFENLWLRSLEILSSTNNNYFVQPKRFDTLYTSARWTIRHTMTTYDRRVKVSTVVLIWQNFTVKAKYI